MNMLLRSLLKNISSKDNLACNYICNEIRLYYAQYHTIVHKNNSIKSQFKGFEYNKSMQRDHSMLSRLKFSYINFALKLNDLYKNSFGELFLFGIKSKKAGLLWYASLDGVDIADFFNLLEMQNNFYSRFIVIELHVWMLLLVLPQKIGKNKDVRYALIEAMWKDNSERAEMMAPYYLNFKKNMKEIYQKFVVSLFLYDIGYLDSDISLANAVWYCFFGKKDVDPRYIEALVLYIRHQVQHLNSLNLEKVEENQMKGIWLSLQPFVDEVFKKS